VESQQNTLPDNSEAPKALFETQQINKDTLLPEAMAAFEVHMKGEGFANNTVKSFLSDVRLLYKYIGNKPIGNIDTEDLNKFLNWLQYERGVPCSPKTYSRRVTTLKVFFAWLNRSDTVLLNPATSVAQKSVSSPLPTIPTQEQVNGALAVAAAWRSGVDIHGAKRKTDARPYVLLSLLLQTATKKGEAKGLLLDHIEKEDAEAPQIFIRYTNPRMVYKERRIAVEPEWIVAVDEYIAQYKLTDELFTCTPRNLEYILKDVGSEAMLDPGLLSFENLRWVSALYDLNNGVEPDLIREKLGLSKITWRETKHKLEQLREIQAE
jgi:site-specific recombinase XerD